MEQQLRALVDISEVIASYLPMSRKKAIRFCNRYLHPKRIGNKLYIDRTELQKLLNDTNIETFPL